MDNMNTSIKKAKFAIILVTCVLSFLSTQLYGQSDRKFIRQGNREFKNEKFSEAEIYYRRALSDNKESEKAVFNVGDALYKQNKFEDAGKHFMEHYRMTDNKKKKAESMYNLGNSLLMNEKLKESIEAYKESLKLDPQNVRAKYNLAYAQDKLRQQEEPQQQQQQNQQQEDNNKDDEQKQNNEQEREDNNRQDEQQPEDGEDQQSISREDAERILKALENEEKDVQEKVKREKAAKTRVQTIKNW
ncbi:MAG TPA: tetratricopeptide repeat protein [Bacteroidales bacterium]|nr:tetratricopeptide repeat protein [Bacteroidales bacterium]HPI68910.1 tetratricopeptide repeat protein [Bacteroidales bacterium]